MRFRGILVLVVLAAAVAGPSGAGAQEKTAATAASPPAAAPSGTVDPNEYRIGPGDVLQISVWKNDAVSRTVPVRPDGKISLPLLNDLDAAGYTPMELRDILVKKLAEYMPAPEVSVIVTEPRSFKVSVMGEVAKPGRFELQSRTSVLDVLALAGGLNQYAAKSRIFVLRPDGKGMKRLPFNYGKAVGSGGEQENFYLQSGDIVVVP
jgi:polysaccharide biosynthesis/export protein